MPHRPSNRRLTDSLAAIAAWHDGRPRASLAHPAGWAWAAVIAATFFWMSNPLVYVYNFRTALDHSLLWTAVVVVLTLPWLRLPRVPWPWIAFLVFAMVSTAWSANVSETHTSTVLYFQITVLAVVVAANCGPEVVAWGLGMGGVVVTALSVHAFNQRVPGSFYAEYERIIIVGVGMSENILSYTVVIALAATLALGAPRRALPCVLWIVMLGVNAYGMVRANSGTGYLTILILLLVGASVLAWPALRRARRRVLTILAVASAALLLAALYVITVALDKDVLTLSGRSPFWRATISVSFDQNPLLGAGWGTVWEHPWNPALANPIADDIYARAGYYLAHGHNFFIDVLPELGLVGVLLAFAMVVRAVRELGRCGLQTGAADPVAGRLLLMVLTALLVSGLTEPMLTVPIGWWALALVVALPRQRIRFQGRGRSRPRGRRIATPVDVPVPQT